MKHQALAATALLTSISCAGPPPSPHEHREPPPSVETPPARASSAVRASIAEASRAAHAALDSARAPRAPLAAALSEPACDVDAKLPRKRARLDQLQPPHDPARERTLIGPGTPPGAHPAWPAAADGVTPAAPGASVARTLLRGPNLSDSMTRVRLSTADALDLTLLVRTRSQDAPDGYGIRLKGNTAQWVRLDAGAATPLAAPEVIHRLAKRPSIELIVLTSGPNLLAQVHDAKTGVEIAILHAEDPTHSTGQAGLTAPDVHTNPPATSVDLLTSRAACDLTPARALERPPRRFVTLDADAFAGLPADVRSALVVRERPGRSVVAQTDLLGVEMLQCAGEAPESISSEIPWKFVDETYLSYRDLPPVRAPDGFRLELSPKSPAMVAELLTAYHRDHPDHTRLEVIGRSLEGRPILALAIGQDLQPDDPRPVFLLNGGHHGDEPTSTDISLDAIDQLLRGVDDPTHPHARFTRDLVVWVVPQVNPDGAFAFLEDTWRTGRKNGRDHDGDGHRERLEGVDLNRNYPFRFADLPGGSSSEPLHDKYRGESAASEPETRAMMSLAHATVPAASISYHSGTVCVLAPYTIDGTPDPRPNDAWQIGKHVTNLLPVHPEGRAFKLRRNLYAVDGTDQDWLRHELGTVALLVEAARLSPRDPCARRAIIDANRPSWLALLERMLDGPTVSGRVIDSAGAAAAGVEVHLASQDLRAGESWRTRADGRFVRFPTKEKRVTLVVRHPNHPDHEVDVDLDSGRVTPVEITLPYALTSSSSP